MRGAWIVCLDFLPFVCLDSKGIQAPPLPFPPFCVSMQRVSSCNRTNDGNDRQTSSGGPSDQSHLPLPTHSSFNDFAGVLDTQPTNKPINGH